MAPVRCDIEQRPVKILLLGQVFRSDCPLPDLFDSDPLYDYVSISTRTSATDWTTGDLRHRYARMYFPRTTTELEQYSMIFCIDTDVSTFTGRHLEWIRRAVEDGKAASYFTFGAHFQKVQTSILSDLVPHDMSQWFQTSYPSGHYKVQFARNLPPVFTPFAELGVENVPGMGRGFLVPRPGTTIWGYMIPRSLGPWMLEWRFGDGGHSWVSADDLDTKWWSDVHAVIQGYSQNPWSMDIMSNIIIYSVGRNLPLDVQAVSAARRGFTTYRTQKGLLVSLMDFVEKFERRTI